MTLIELSVVLVILIGLAGVVMPYASGVSNRAACTTTDASMVAIRDAIMGTGGLPGFNDDVGRLPIRIEDLFNTDNDTAIPPNRKTFKPITQRGWHGPYLMNGTLSVATEGNFDNDDYVRKPIGVTILDSWGNPIILQTPEKTANIRLVSAGPDQVLYTRLNDNDASDRNDDRVLFIQAIDPRPEVTQDCE